MSSGIRTKIALTPVVLKEKLIEEDETGSQEPSLVVIGTCKYCRSQIYQNKVSCESCGAHI